MNWRTSARRTWGNSAFMPSEPCDDCAVARRWSPPSGGSPACSKSVSYNMRNSVVASQQQNHVQQGKNRDSQLQNKRSRFIELVNHELVQSAHGAQLFI